MSKRTLKGLFKSREEHTYLHISPIRAKTALQNKSGEGYIDTAVKIIIGVVIGALILGGLYALFNNVVIPNLNTEIGDMFNYAG